MYNKRNSGKHFPLLASIRGFINSSRLSQRAEHLFPHQRHTTIARTLRLSHPDQLPRNLRALNEARNNSPRLPPFFNRHTSTPGRQLPHAPPTRLPTTYVLLHARTTGRA